MVRSVFVLRIHFSLLVLLLLLVGVLPGHAAEETWYAQRLTSGDAPVRVDHLWSRGGRLRAETVIAGRPIVTLVDGDRYTIIDTVSMEGISVERSPTARATSRNGKRPFGNEGDRMKLAGAERVRTEKIGSRSCEVYRLTNREGRSEICVTQDKRPLPLQINYWSRTSSQSVMIRYLDWTRGIPLPDAFFQVDPRAKLEELSYEEYVKESRKRPVGPAPPFFSHLLHGTPDS